MSSKGILPEYLWLITSLTFWFSSPFVGYLCISISEKELGSFKDGPSFTVTTSWVLLMFTGNTSAWVQEGQGLTCITSPTQCQAWQMINEIWKQETITTGCWGNLRSHCVPSRLGFLIWKQSTETRTYFHADKANTITVTFLLPPHEAWRWFLGQHSCLGSLISQIQFPEKSLLWGFTVSNNCMNLRILLTKIMVMVKNTSEFLHTEIDVSLFFGDQSLNSNLH